MSHTTLEEILHRRAVSNAQIAIEYLGYLEKHVDIWQVLVEKLSDEVTRTYNNWKEHQNGQAIEPSREEPHQ